MQVEKKTIREVIVVEGHHDTDTLRKYFNCDTIETSGTHLGKEVLDRIAYAQKTRGVIIFTDPDSPGNRIRHAVNQAVPGCKNAFIEKKDAHTTKKVGVEHAGFEPIQEALSHLVTYEEKQDTLTMQDMIALGLSGGPESSALRSRVGSRLHLGDGNAKTMLHRLNFLSVTYEELWGIIHE